MKATEAKTRSKLFTKEFVIIWLTTFVIFFVLNLLLTVLAVYSVDEFAASQSMAGLVAGIFIIGELIARLITGRYMEIWGRRKTLFSALILYLLLMLLYFPANSLIFLLLIRFFHGAVFGVAVTVLAVAVVDAIPVQRRGEGISYYSMSMTLAMGLGPSLGAFLAMHTGFKVIFGVCSALCLLSIVIALFARIPTPPSEAPAASKGPKPTASKGLRLTAYFSWRNFFEITALPISFIIFLMTYAYSGILTFINAYAREINLAGPAAFYFIVYATSIIISRLITGPLFDRKGENIVIYPSLAFYVLGMFLFSRAGHGFTLLLAAAFIGLGLGSLNSCGQAIAVKVAPKHRIGLATSTFFVFLDGGLGIGPYLHGLIIPFSGYRGLYLILSMVLLASIPLYYVLHGRKAKEPSFSERSHRD